MYPHTQEFRRRLADPDSYITRVYSLLDPTADPVEVTEYFAGGHLTIGRQEIRTSGEMTFRNDDGAMLPVGNPDHPLAPYGQELLAYRGVAYDVDGVWTEELIPQGPLRVTAVSLGPNSVTVRCFDRAWRVKRAKNETPITIAAGTPSTEAMETLIRTAWPEVDIVIVPSDDVTPTIVIDAFSDPWAEAQKIAAAIGYELYFDRVGVCQIHPELDRTGDDPVWSYDDASLEFIPRRPEHWANLGLPTIGVDWDTEDTFNVWVVRGENSELEAPVQGLYRDLDPSSPTRHDSRFGPAVSVTVDPLVMSEGQAIASAAARAAREVGVAEAVRVPAMLNPAIDLGDPTLIVRARLGLNQVHIIDSYTLPLVAAEQALGTRLRRVVETIAA
jgi:hypothetical protein